MTRLLYILCVMLMAGVARAGAVNTEKPDTLAEVEDTLELNLQVSVITCDPGPDAYQMFGHTALRIRDLDNPEYDFVYNYGVFDSRRDNFIYYFVKGETDYTLSADKAERFVGKYSGYFGIPMREQVLNLTDEQKSELEWLLEINAQKENCTYRYNFLYDNCTTRAARKIEEALNVCKANLVYKQMPVERENTTFRDILHRFTSKAPWLEFGIDLVLGAEVDKPRSQMEQMFIPSVFEDELSNAVIKQEDGETVNIVLKTEKIAPTVEMKTVPDFPLSPFVTFLILLVLVSTISLFDVKRCKLSSWLDISGFFIRGLAGFLVAFLFFFSEHPAVGSNWLVLAFNPLVFFMIPDVVYITWQKRFMKKVTIKNMTCDLFEVVNLAVLIFTLMLFVLPIQQLNIAMLPLVLTLLVRSITRITVLGKNTVNKTIYN